MHFQITILYYLKCGVSTLITDKKIMESQLLQIRDQQKEIWNRFSPGWKKWDDLTMDFLRPMGDQIIKILHPHDTDVVLDIAAGTGEPGLSIASKLNGGIVVITDVSEGMLDVARENASRRGIKNVEFSVCDVSELPFPDNSFDLISCRFGFMFFPDMKLAAKEMLRVLKPGGKIATAVWNVPEKNFWASAALNVINRHVVLPPPVAGAPGLFRCAEKNLVAQILRDAGFIKVTENVSDGKLTTGTTEVYWSFMTEVVAPVVAALSKADDKTRDKIKSEVFEAVEQRYPNGKVAIDCSALVINGEK